MESVLAQVIINVSLIFVSFLAEGKFNPPVASKARF